MFEQEEIKGPEFDEKVIKSDKLVLIDLWADWCHPCKLIEPFVFEAAQRHPEKVKVYRLNVDDFPEIPSRYKVISIPTILFFKNGKEVHRIVGSASKKEYIKWVDELVKDEDR